MRDVVVTGESDEMLTAAIYSAGKRLFIKAAARAFARAQAARGDMASASELARLLDHKKPKAWCTGATLALARLVCGVPDSVHVHCEGEHKALIRASIVSGDDRAAVSGLAELLENNETAAALAHARIVGLTAPEVVFEAVMHADINNRTKGYINLLWTIYHAVGSDRDARNAILDAAIAFGSGDLKVRPPSLKEAEERMRMIALYSAPRQRQRPASSEARAARAPRLSKSDTKTLDIAGFGRAEPPIEIVKC